MVESWAQWNDWRKTTEEIRRLQNFKHQREFNHLKWDDKFCTSCLRKKKQKKKRNNNEETLKKTFPFLLCKRILLCFFFFCTPICRITKKRKNPFIENNIHCQMQTLSQKWEAIHSLFYIKLYFFAVKTRVKSSMWYSLSKIGEHVPN